MKLLNPIKKELTDDSLKQILLNCLSLDKYKAIVVFNDIDKLTECAYKIPNYYLASIDRVNHSKKNEIYILFRNQSKLYFVLNKEFPCAHRINALLYDEGVNSEFFNTVFDPMLNIYKK